MELVGERWSLLIVRELMLGARRFSDIRARLPGISAKVLTERLLSLEEAGVLMRRQLPPPGKAQVYELTAWVSKQQTLNPGDVISCGAPPGAMSRETKAGMNITLVIDQVGEMSFDVVAE